MKKIIFLNNKGGVGKTASVTTVAHMLATKYNKKVLVIDLDPQMNSTCMFSEVNFMDLFVGVYKGRYSKKEESVEDLLLNKDMDIHKCIKKTCYENLDIIPAFLTLSEAEERMKADVRSPQQFRLKNHLQSIEDEYDFCIMDSSPSISIINVNGLAAADRVYIPLRCDGGSMLGVAITMSLCETVKGYNPTLDIGGMFFTQWNGRKNVSKAVYEQLDSEFHDYLLPVTIGSSKNIEEGSLVQKPLYEYDKRCKVTEDYLELTKYIMKC